MMMDLVWENKAAPKTAIFFTNFNFRNKGKIFYLLLQKRNYKKVRMQKGNDLFGEHFSLWHKT